MSVLCGRGHLSGDSGRSFDDETRHPFLLGEAHKMPTSPLHEECRNLRGRVTCWFYKHEGKGKWYVKTGACEGHRKDVIG